MAGKNKGPRIIKRKETQYERKERFNKRSKSLLKKAFELSVLCDIDVALIMYSPTGKLGHFSGNKKPERILQDYIQSLATNPETNPMNEESIRPVISQDTIDKINRCASQADTVNQEGLEAPEREEINEEIRQYQNRLLLLQEQAKKLYPKQGMSNSMQESMERKRYLAEVLHKVMERKNQLLSRFNIRSTTILPPNMQQLQNFTSQGGEQVQLPGITLNSGKQMVTQEVPLEVDPTYWQQYEADLNGHQYPPMAHDHEASSSRSQLSEQMVLYSQQIPMQQPQAEAEMMVPPHGGEQAQLQGSNQPQELSMQQDTDDGEYWDELERDLQGDD